MPPVKSTRPIPMPLTCGAKKRDAADDSTTKVSL